MKIDNNNVNFWNCIRNKKHWIAFIFLSIFFYFFTMQEDIHATCINSYSLLDAIFRGNRMYQFETPFYIPIHIIFSIWNLPIYLLNVINLIPLDSMLSFLWSKLLICGAFCGVLLNMKEIMNIYKVEKTEFWLFMFCTSLLVFLPVFSMCQYDFLGLCFFLIGFKKTLKEESLSSKTLILLSISSCFKLLLFPICIFVILSKEKEFKKIFRCIGLLLSCIIAILILATFISSISIEEGSNNGFTGFNFFINYISVPSVKGGLFDISAFIVIYIILLFYTFNMKSCEYNNFILWVFSLFYLSWLLFAKMHPQWSVLYECFIILLISTKLHNNQLITCMLLLELCIFTQQAFYYYWVYFNEGAFDFLLLKNINTHLLTKTNWTNIKDVFSVIFGEYYNSFMIIIESCAIALGIICLYFSSPFCCMPESKNVRYGVYRKAKLIILIAYVAILLTLRFII